MHVFIATYIFLCTVPQPRVEVSVDSGHFISDGRVTLLCTVNLPSTVNSGELVTTTWFGPSGQLTNSSNVTISNAYSIADRVFQSSVIISNFFQAVDNGEYTCNVTVIPSSSYVISNRGSGRRRVMISGQ